MIRNKVWALTPAKIILGGFFLMILCGGILLSLPVASKSGAFTPFIDALFTAASAACVTGLVVHDTYTYWSPFGQGVILSLIQIGGMGVVTLAVLVTMITGRKIGLKQRFVMQESISAPKMGGIVRMTGFIVKGTLLFEAAGAVIMAIQFCPRFGLLKGSWFAVFHSVSAFCNAGFDLMGGTTGPYSSLTGFKSSPLVVLPVMALIVIGGIGFFVWDDLSRNRGRFKFYSLQTKVVLTTTLFLIILPAVMFFFFEFTADRWEGFSLADRFYASLFQAVTPRTAGFNTVPLNDLSAQSQLVTIILMMIGGSPGSTAGGIKTTTFALAVLCIRSVFQNQDSIHCYKRRVSYDVLRNAIAILVLYLFLFLAASFLITGIDGATMMESSFESASAIATVGLSLGITEGLGTVSKLVLILLMFFGRVGGLTMLYALTSQKKMPVHLPQERLTVG